MNKEIIEQLVKQREELSDKIERLKGTKYTATRDALLGDIRSLDEVLKEFAKTLTPQV